ncbi:MAG: U32 family peptidase [Nitrospirae bacterium]|nr:U32 family peptidase [Nitrospirota bacterium]
MKRPELLAPAGSIEKLVTALHYGADAVYLGLSEFSLRAKADNFSSDELADAVRLARRYGRKIYITVNIIPHAKDIPLIREHLGFMKNLAPDGIIISDPGVFDLAKEIAPGIPVHISTQANITNPSSAKFWERAGAKRLVLSRELTLEEIKEIRESVALELECFVHGAICISYSGRCYISSFLANRSANRGECTNSCRWNYTLMEEKRPDVFHPVFEDDRGTYLMSSKDLCMIEHLDKLADAGIDSFKIEGRMKGINYVAGVVKAYREAVDALAERPFRAQERWMKEIEMFSSRGYTTGMFFGRQPDNGYNHDEKDVYRMSHELVGIVKTVENGRLTVLLRNVLNKGDSVEFLTTGLEEKPFIVDDIRNDRGRPLESGRNDEIVSIPSVPGVRANDLIRRPK